MAKIINSLISLALACLPVFANPEPSFEEARKNHLLRREIIENLPMVKRKIYPCRVVYDEKEIEIKMNASAVTVGRFIEGKLQNLIVYVEKSAFEDISSIRTHEDLRHLVESHEYAHTIQQIKGMGKLSSFEIEKAILDNRLDYETSMVSSEVDAYHSSVKDIYSGKFKVSQVYQTRHLALYSAYHQRLRKILNQSEGFDREFILEVLKKTSDIYPLKILFDFKGLLFPF